ncbi:hypothetical protein M5K25_018107 [Dendrobium thyrsiflorum]|uniref:FAF domain-containing protein n=1 Tax=Dendrobium thyrsiflorum TaxID=117978 RepID=A0ABD0UHC7_DENTH
MSVAVCRTALYEPVLPVANSWLSEMVKPAQPPKSAIQTEEKEEEKQRFDIWNSIQTNRENMNSATPPTYIHPLVRRYSILMSQKSLETCTENLGSETGSDEFSSGDELDSFSCETENEEEEAEEEEEFDCREIEKRDVFNVNYHCSIGRRSPLRSFPPPLPSISRRDGPCFKMQPHRRDGRLIVQAVPVPSVNYLHAERRGGRLLLSFVDTSSSTNSPVITSIEKSQQNKEEDEETMKETEEEEEETMDEEEEEVEVVDRGTTIEVKVSTQAAVKVHRSSLVINKFVVGSREAEYNSPAPEEAEFSGKKSCFAATTAAAAAVAASSMSTLTSTTEGFQFNYLHDRHISRWGQQSPAAAAATEAKLLFTSKRRSREELLHDMRRCSELRRPLFIFEQPYCIATS